MSLTRPSLLILALGVALAGCGTAPVKTSQNEETPVIPPYKGGGYYKDDGPGANPPANLAAVPDAVPKWEPLHRHANDSYKVLGREYDPLPAGKAYKAKGLASWYGRKFHGKATSTGEPYDMYAMSAAHPTLPLPSYARVTNLENGKTVVVRVNDRGPFHDGRIIDLSYTAAYKLDILKGVTPVEVEVVLPETDPTSFSAQADEPFAPSSRPQAEAAPPAAPAASRSEPAFVRNDKAIYLQLGAYSKPATADGVLARASAILSKGFPGVMRLESNGLFKIQAGPFANGEEADRAAGRVLAELGIQAYKVAGEAPAMTAAAPTTASAVPAPLTPGLYLQLGAVSSSEAAEALAGRVKSRFGGDLPGLAQVSAGNLVKVQAGPFASPAAAEKLALAYQQDFGVKPYKVLR
jgi:rare lipoprotein A